MIAFCGLNCSECPAYLATKTGDDKKRIETAKKMVGNLQIRHKTGGYKLYGVYFSFGRYIQLL